MEEEQIPEKDFKRASDELKTPYKSDTKRYSEILRDFDNLELTLFCSTTDELLPDFDSQSIPESISTEITEPVEQDTESQSEDGFSAQICSDATEMDNISAQDADVALCRCEGGVEIALQYAKMWCRYAKDLLAWMEKRFGLEQEYAKNIIKTAEGARSCLAYQDTMPLQYIYTMAMEQDIKNSVASKYTSELLHQRCFQTLSAKKNEIDKWRREFKEQWTKEQKRMNDAVTALKKARQQYVQRCEELEKAKAVTAKAADDTSGHKTLDRRRKSRDEAQSKVIESETHYKQCACEARIHQDELVKVKERIISHVRKLICQGDNVLKEATVNMFYYQRQQTEPVPLGYHNLEQTCRRLEPGEPYVLYVLKMRRHDQPLQSFTFQEYVPQCKGLERSKRKTSNPLSSVHDLYTLPDDNQARRSNDGRKMGYSDSESMEGSMESLSSPAQFQRKLPKVLSAGTLSLDDVDEKDVATMSESDLLDSSMDGNGPLAKMRIPSRAALTHRLRKMKSKMVKCKQCETYIVVSGIECQECGLAVHRKCLEVCQLECDRRKGVVFGVGICLLPCNGPDQVPFIVQRCTAEIESRALSVQGIYRVSGSKPRIQRLCQAFEAQKDQVELSDLSPHDISSVLKHFFKELPEPLLTFDLYSDFINVGKAIQRLSESEPVVETTRTAGDIIHNLRELLGKLPPHCYNTLQHTMSHLHRVSENFEQNMMSPGNLGIVFGPTLLRPLVSVDMSMVALLESNYQALLVEFLIAHHDQVFGPPPRASTPTPPAPTTPPPGTPRRASCPPNEETTTVQEHGTSCRERPQSLESRTIKRDSSEGYISDKSSSNEAVDQLSPEANEAAVLVVRGASAAPKKEPVGGADSTTGSQPHYSFTRQLVKYQRHPTPGTRLRNPKNGQPAAKARNAVKADRKRSESTRSSSPDPEAGAGPNVQSVDAPRETSYQSQQATGLVTEGQGGVPVSPRQVVEYMLGLDPMSASSTATTATLSVSTPDPGPEPWSGSEPHPSESRSNNRQGIGPGRALCLSPKQLHGEQTLSAPAQKILSGLKLKRSHSGKDEQLFV